MAFDPLTGVLNFGGKIIDKIFPDKTEAAKAKVKLMEMEQTGELEELKSAAKVITAEATSDHWIVAAWRPITMLVFVAIVANNYILYPYLSLFWNAAPKLTVPDQLWSLLQIGLGGYVVGRSGEKIAKVWKS